MQLETMLDSILNETEIIHGRRLMLFKDAGAIAVRVREIGQTLTRTHQGHRPIVIGLMQGAFIFTADLVRAIQLPCVVDFWRLSSYGDRMTSNQSIQEIMPPTVPLRDQHVILVEDVVDSGRTLTYVRQQLSKYGPKSVTIVSLVKVKGSPIEVDHVGFISSGEFIVGYGLDIAQELRELPALYYLKSAEPAND
ncbi:MAG: hypoxanthine phosphoribosyltransferase [Rhodothermaceae bacterium]|nr:hypoxanthine phosphoribosyltransferase [Rhodothermaceae bacterium]MYG70789.1 hypoxanthine phosphoribosyltransferase [Rhodothermaceae bacterium]MYJ44255.1 hypoxanthine phosphoribosyltransferase [Rhodothermaceae bacterium]